MISRKILTEVLEKALSSGADFAEIYVEHTKQNNISMVDSRVDAITDRLICGVGIRILKGTRCVSGSTSSLERNDLLALAARIAQAHPEVRQLFHRHALEVRQHRKGSAVGLGLDGFNNCGFFRPVHVIPLTFGVARWNAEPKMKRLDR